MTWGRRLQSLDRRWIYLITALIGVVPGGGDAVKRGLRAVKSRAIPINDLLDAIRRVYRGDPERALREALDVGKLQRLLNQMLDNPALTRRLSHRCAEASTTSRPT